MENETNVVETPATIPTEVLEEIKEAQVEAEEKHVHSEPFFTQRISLKEKRRRRLANKRAREQRRIQRRKASGK